MEKIDAKIIYTAKKAFADIRAGIDLDDDLMAELHMTTALQCLRAECTEDDIPLLKKKAEEGSESENKLAVSILKYDRQKESQETIKSRHALFESLWESRPDPPKIRINLMWRLLDYDKLPLEWHKKLYDFITANKTHWSEFKQTQVGYLGEGRTDKGEGDQKKVLSNLEKRLFDKNIPSSKRWAYCCSAMVLEDVISRLRLIDAFVTGADDFTKEVVEHLKSVTYNELEEQEKTHKKENWSRHDALIWGVYHRLFSHGELCVQSSTCNTKKSLSQAEGFIDQIINIEDGITGDTRPERTFKRIILSMHEQCNIQYENYNSLAEKSLKEWKWYSDFSTEINEISTQEINLNKRKVMQQISDLSDAWALRFSCLCQLANNSAQKCKQSNDWYKTTYIDPLMLDLPLPCKAITADTAVKLLPEAMDRNTNESWRKTARSKLIENISSNFRAIQWEVMPRDHYSERKNGDILLIPKVYDYLGGLGLLSKKKHTDLAKGAWAQEFHAMCYLEKERIKVDKSDKTILSNISENVCKSIGNIHEEILKNLSSTKQKTFSELKRYLWFVRSLMREIKESNDLAIPNDFSKRDLILIEDGELTFFSLLHQTRNMMRKYQKEGREPNKIDQWLMAEKDGKKSDCHCWTKNNISNFMLESGIFFPIANGRWCATRRFKSFVNWYRKFHKKCCLLKPSSNINDTNAYIKEEIMPLLPIKAGERHNIKFVLKIFSIIRSKKILKWLNCVISTKNFIIENDLLNDLIRELLIIKAVKELELQGINITGMEYMVPENVSYLEWAFSARYENSFTKINNEASVNYCNGEDVVLLRTNRTCNLFLEKNIRSYQPYPISLLVLPFDFRYIDRNDWPIFERAGFEKKDPIPSAVTFVSIIGELGIKNSSVQDEDVMDNIQICHNLNPLKNPIDQAGLAHMYQSVFQPISTSVAIKSHEETATRLSAYYVNRTERSKQGHEFKELIRLIDSESNSELLDFLRKYFFSLILDKKTLSEAQSELPKIFFNKKKEKLSDVIRKAMEYAGQIQYLKDGVGDDPAMVEYNDIVYFGESYQLDLCFANSVKNLTVRDTTNKVYRIRAHFLSMLLAVFLNILKNVNDVSHPIVLRFTPNSQLEFLNVWDGCLDSVILKDDNLKNILKDNISFNKPYGQNSEDDFSKFGGTLATLDSLITNISNMGGFKSAGYDVPAAEMFRLEEHKIFVTHVPCPSILI